MIRIEGARIREARERKGLSQGQLAYKANTTATQVSRLENNQRPGAEAQVLGRIAAALDVSVDFLLGMTDDPAAEHDGGLLDAQAAYLLQELEEILVLLPPERREHIMRTAITLADAHRVAAESFERREQEQHAQRRIYEPSSVLCGNHRITIAGTRLQFMVALYYLPRKKAIPALTFWTHPSNNVHTDSPRGVSVHEMSDSTLHRDQIVTKS